MTDIHVIYAWQHAIHLGSLSTREDVVTDSEKLCLVGPPRGQVIASDRARLRTTCAETSPSPRRLRAPRRRPRK
jgi:hypothetical protein